MLIGGLLLAVGIGVVIWAIASAQQNARETSQHREAVEDYTGQVRSLFQQISEPVSEMAEAPIAVEDEAVAALEEDAVRWSSAFQETQALVGGLVSAPGMEGATEAFGQALLLYISAADTYRRVPKLHGKAAGVVLSKAGEFRDRATGVLEAGLATLEAERVAVDLDPSGLVAPSGVPVPQALPTPTPEPTRGEGRGGKGKGGNKKGKDGGSRDGGSGDGEGG